MIKIASLLAAFAVAVSTPLAASSSPPPPLRLYTLDCGQVENIDLTMFSDTGDNDGKHSSFVAPCYLIRDGDRWMLWDTGLGDALIKPAEVNRGDGHQRWSVRRTLVSQLAQIGLKPSDVSLVGLSHYHADHTGNLGLFTNATVLMGGPEIAAAKGNEMGSDPKAVALIDSLKIKPLFLDEDVFGDGRVVIFATPGHTPGHRSLLVRLPNSGPVILAGDLWHTRDNYEKSLIPQFNSSRADTLASFDRVRRMAARLHARVVVQHAAEDFGTMPAFPAYLD